MLYAKTKQCTADILIYFIAYLPIYVSLREECKSNSNHQLFVVLLLTENDTTLAVSTTVEKSPPSLASVGVTSVKTTGMVDEADVAFY